MDWPKFFAMLLWGTVLFVNGYVVGVGRESSWYRKFTRDLLDDYGKLLIAYTRAYRVLEENGLVGGDDDGREPEHDVAEGGTS